MADRSFVLQGGWRGGGGWNKPNIFSLGSGNLFGVECYLVGEVVPNIKNPKIFVEEVYFSDNQSAVYESLAYIPTYKNPVSLVYIKLM